MAVAPGAARRRRRPRRFDYDGDVGDAALRGAGAKNGVPPDVYALDVGARTTEAFKASIGRAKTIFWTGLLGAAECGAWWEGVTTQSPTQHGGPPHQLCAAMPHTGAHAAR